MGKEKKERVVPAPYEVIACDGCGGSFMRVELIPQQDGKMFCDKCNCPHLNGTRRMGRHYLHFDENEEPYWVEETIVVCNDCGKILERIPPAKNAGHQLELPF